MPSAPLIKDMKECARKLGEYGSQEALIIHHDEADGLCSAAIVKTALEREGFKVRRLCLDKLFPAVATKLHSESGKIYVYSDIGSAHVKRISELNGSRNLVIILDHHDTEPPDNPAIYNLNPELHGMSGERDASSSTVAYLFARSLSPENKDLAYLAVVGSAEIPGPPTGLNREVLDEAIKGKLVEVRKSRSGEDFRILVTAKPLSYRRFSTLLSVLGSVGYYRDGPNLGMRACLGGFKDEIEEVALRLEEERKEANRQLLERLRREGLNKTEHLQWFHAGDNFRGMGTKVIGSFCSYLSFQGFTNPAKYLVGFMNMLPAIPGFGELDREYVKVSARAPRLLGRMIEEGKRPPLSKILPKACEAHGGFGDGHTVAASGVIDKGLEERFVAVLDELCKI